jgi:hypothetical protein
MKQDDRELDVFARFISIAGLPIDPASVQKCHPPSPDILCHHATDGLIAFELTELINHDLSARLGRQCTSQDVLELTHEQLPPDGKQSFDDKFGNANLCFKFHSDTTTKKVRGNLSEVFVEFSRLPNGFIGEMNDFASRSVSKIIESVSVSRGGFTGPIFSVENVGGLGDSVVRTIQKKLTKTYQSVCPIELLGYIDLVGMFPPQLWHASAIRFFAGVSGLGPFRRIWIVDIRNERVVIIRNAA